MIGKTLGEYRILEEIGRGGMGVVYLAEHVRLKEKYALKILPEAVCDDPDFVERFFIEARVMAKLDHPHIVRVFNMGRAEGVYFLVMDYITGPEGRSYDLHDLFEDRGGKLPPDELKEIILQVCEALQYAHDFQDDDVKDGVIHRDLKPLNILIQGSSGIKIKVSDFGLAKIVGDEYVSSLIGESISRSMTGRKEIDEDDLPTMQRYQYTNTGSLVGTYDYMSPEAKYGQPVDKRTDIYSLGVMIYYLLTGRKPAGFPKPPSALIPGLSSGWDNIVSRCLQENRKDRYQSVEEVAADIRQVGRKGGKKMWWKAAVFLIAAGLAGGYIFFKNVGKGPEAIIAGRPLVIINSDPESARVYLDSEYKGETPLRVTGLAPGSYKLVLEKDGYNQMVQMVGIKEGKNVYSFELAWVTGNLRVESDPEGAEIYLDGKSMGKTNQVLPGIIVGSHQLVLKLDGYLPVEKPVTVKKESEVKVIEKLRLPPGKIMVRSQPPGASVFINERDTGKKTTLSGFEVDPGEVTVAVTLAGYGSAEMTRAVHPDTREHFNFELKKTEVNVPLELIDLGKGYYRFEGNNYPLEVKTLPEKAGIEMVLIPPGEFTMGTPLSAEGVDPDESPQHREVISRPFYLGKYEVTVGQFKEFIRRTGYQTIAEENGFALIYTDRQVKKPGICWKTPGFTQQNDHPVVLLEWEEAQKFCRWMGKGFRLPTEVEWEYACRAGTETRFYWGDDLKYTQICEYANGADLTIKNKYPNWHWAANNCNDGFLETAPVGSFLSNAFRLYDMTGNVWEWCQDWYDPTGEAENVGVRGGSWHYGPMNLRSANRSWRKRSYGNNDIGFRVARTIAE